MTNVSAPHRYQRDEEERERDALMSREFAPNDASRSHGVSGDTSILIDAALTQHQRVSSAHKGVDQLIDTGANVLASLRDQRGTLKVRPTLSMYYLST